jgi:hypothetical protein
VQDAAVRLLRMGYAASSRGVDVITLRSGRIAEKLSYVKG